MSETSSKWTKLIAGTLKFLPEAQWVTLVVELLSHLTTAMGVTSGDSKQSLEQIAAMRGDLSQMSAQHTSLAQLLNAQTAALDGLATELQAAKMAAAGVDERLSALEGRFAGLEARGARSFALAVVGCVLAAASVALLIVVLVRLH
jgi:septal ring factor EnvC (AmiA/AmiB activator)